MVYIKHVIYISYVYLYIDIKMSIYNLCLLFVSLLAKTLPMNTKIDRTLQAQHQNVETPLIDNTLSYCSLVRKCSRNMKVMDFHFFLGGTI